MTILKKKRIIQLSIYKSAGWYVDEDQKILEPTKIPLIRLPVKCGRKCEFSKICSFWNPSFRFEGIKIHKIQKHSSYGVSGDIIDICNCGFDGSKFEYIFTYEIIRHYLPVDVLEEMGLYKEPKAAKKQIFFDNPPKNYNTKNIKSYGGGNRNYKNYNARRK